MSRTLIIVPTYNERENLPRMAAALRSLPVQVDLLVVDDNSPDGTGKQADELAAQHPEVHVLHRAGKEGLGRAYLAGFAWALQRGYEFIFEMDCDFSHDPREIPRFLQAAERADLVIGSRYCNGVRVLNWPLKRLLLSRCAGVYVQLVTGMPMSDPTGGFKCFRRRALQSIPLSEVRSKDYSFQIEMTHRLWRQGFVIGEVPIIFKDRERGVSKMRGGIVNEAFWMVWRLWLQNGMRRHPRGSGGGTAVAGSGEAPLTSRRRPSRFDQFIKFCLIGGSGVIVDMAVLHFLADPKWLGWNVSLSKVFSAETAMLTNFLGNEIWTFRDATQPGSGRAGWLRRLLVFNAICGIGIVFAVLLLDLFYYRCHLNLYVANFLAILLVTLWNFWMNAKFNWTAKFSGPADGAGGGQGAPK